MAAETKPQFSPEVTDFESYEESRPSNARRTRVVESARQGLTVLTLLLGLSIVGTSGETLRVYNKTHVSSNFLLPLWPFDLNLRPTVALVTCSSILVVSSIIALIGSKVPAVRALWSVRSYLDLTDTYDVQLQNKPLIQTMLSVFAPTTGLIAALVAVSFFYAMNASDTTDTVLSWTCRWSDVIMTDSPHWNQLCKESQAALYTMVVLIPLELGSIALAAWIHMDGKKLPNIERKASPALS